MYSMENYKTWDASMEGFYGLELDIQQTNNPLMSDL